jgi:hypothetical protein
MTKKQENTVSMWSVVDDTLTTNNAIWITLLAFKNAVIKFRAARTALSATSSKQQKQTKGVAADKKALKTIAVDKAVQAALNIQAYAKDNNNNTLWEEMKIPNYKIMRSRDELSITILNNIHKASAPIPTIADYGNTTATQTALRAAIDAYALQVPKPREAIVDKKTATTNLAAIIKDGNAALATLDNLIGNFAATAPDFVTTFTSARIITDLTGGVKKKTKKTTPTA